MADSEVREFPGLRAGPSKQRLAVRRGHDSTAMVQKSAQMV